MWKQIFITIFVLTSYATAFSKLDVLGESILQELINRYDNRIKDAPLETEFELVI